MDIFSVELNVLELQIIRQSLDVITIKGSDAQFIANLQYKLESEINQISAMMAQAEKEKEEQLQKMIAAENRKAKKQAE
jgi:uncharacterized iron-regulated protein